MEGLLIYDHPLLSPLSLSLAASLGGHSWLSQSVYLSLAFSALFSSALVIPEPQPLLRSPLSKIIFNSFVTPEISSLANNPLCSERTFEEPSVSETNNYSYWLLVHSH